MTIQIKQLEKHFGKKMVLDQISFNLKPHKIYGLLGRNGAGKSTLLKIINNRIFANGGEIYIDDQLLTKNSETQLLYLMSEANLFDTNLKLKKIIQQTITLQPDFDVILSQELCAKFQVDTKSKYAALSTGYKTIFKAILALCSPAKYIFLDEPILGLDANHRQLLYQAIISNFQETEKTFVLSTHIIEEIANIIEHVLIIDQQQLIIDDDLDDFLAKSYLISGPQAVVEKYCQNLNVLTKEQVGNLAVYSLYDELPKDVVIDDLLKIEHLNLQQTFINIIRQRGEHHDDA